MSVQTITKIPQKAYKEIKWCLFNYEKLDKFIEQREDLLREEKFDYYHFTIKNNLKNINSYGYTIDNCIIALEEDRLIKRYKKWKKVIRKYMNDVDNINNFIDYWIVKYAFFDRKNIGFILEHLNLEKEDFKRRIINIFNEIYKRAISEKLYREVI